MPEQKILICWPVGSPGYVTPGSLPDRCCQCGKSVWIAPSSMLLLHDNPGMQIRCMPCAFAHMTTHKGAMKDLNGAIADLTPAQLEEIEEGLRARKN